jgi:hypothetical protein
MNIEEATDVYYESMFGGTDDLVSLLDSINQAMADPKQHMEEFNATLNVPSTDEIATGLMRVALAHGVPDLNLLAALVDAFIIGVLYERANNV